MKRLIFAVLVGGCASIAIGAELPVLVVEGLTVEEAWAKAEPNGYEIYLVINNRNLAGVGPIDIEVPGASATRIVRADGGAFEPTLPGHAELYMQPDGVRIEAIGVSLAEAVPVTLSVGDAEVTVSARVLADGEAPPDHHDYDHG